jgi:hypothetical protein
MIAPLHQARSRPPVRVVPGPALGVVRGIFACEILFAEELMAYEV